MDLQLDSNGDLELVNGGLALVTGLARMKQQIQIRLRFFKGEWRLDQNQGFPMYERVLGVKPYRDTVVAELLRRTILGVPGVVLVKNLLLSLEPSTRILSVGFEAIGDTGESVVFEGFVLK